MGYNENLQRTVLEYGQRLEAAERQLKDAAETINDLHKRVVDLEGVVGVLEKHFSTGGPG